MSLINNTFFALASYAYRWAIGERSHRLTQILAAYAPNAYAEATRQICRWLYPLDATAVDALPHQLRLYCLPTYYGEGYFATLDRLRDAVLTHYGSGSVDQLTQEAERATGTAGFTIAISPDSPAETHFAFVHASVTPRRKIGAFTIGPGFAVGYQVPDIQWCRNIQNAMRYFKPARERFRGFVPPP